MYDALPVATPFDIWFASHFPEEEIDVFYISGAGGFKDTIGHAPPCILECEFHFNSKGREDDIRKNVWMWLEIYCVIRIF